MPEIHEERWRLRSEKGLVGYQRVLPSGVALFAKDRLFWTGEPIDYRHRDRWSGLRDADRNFVYAGDVVYIRSLEEHGVHPQWVVAEGPWRLESLDGNEQRPLLSDSGDSLFGYNDLRIVTHVWKSPEIRALRQRRGDRPHAAGPTRSTRRIAATQLLVAIAVVGTFAAAFGSIGLQTLLLGQVLGAWIGHRTSGEQHRVWIRRAGLSAALAHAVVGAIGYAAAYQIWPGEFDHTAIHLLWAAPAIGFLVGIPALASVVLVGDVMAHVGGGYDDE